MKLVFFVLVFCIFACRSDGLSLNVGNLLSVVPDVLKLKGLGLSTAGKFKYENWANDRKINDVWRVVPNSTEDVVSFANYAYSKGMHVRALGKMHTWSPLTILDASEVSNMMLVDTTTNFKKMEISSRSKSSAVVKVQTGVLMEELLTFLEKNGLGILSTPAPGDLTIGGVLAIDGHGTSIPADGEIHQEGYTYGSISNLVVSLTAVVWDNENSTYILKTFKREDPESKAFLTSLGRTFLTEVELLVGPSFNLRCVSYTNISSIELFAHPDIASSNTRTFASFLAKSGRVETILFPFTAKPWLKVWTVSPVKPTSSRAVSSPYNYIFSDIIPEAISALYSQIQLGLSGLAPLLGDTQYDVTAAGLVATDSSDIWGPAKNTLLYIRPTTLRMTANGYAVVTTRANIQLVINTVFSKYELLVEEFRQNDQYPVNGPLEIRVNGLDKATDVLIPGAGSPSLSAIRPDDKNPHFDVAIWFDVLVIPKTPVCNTFFTEFETFFFETFNRGDDRWTLRPEWSKGWAYTSKGAWLNQNVKETIPNLYQSQSTDDGWAWALSVLNKYDRGNVFSNSFLTKLLV